jgi:hypothetical protein
MERRKFIKRTSIGVAGLGMISACETGIKSAETLTDNTTAAQAPGYRTKIKSSCSASAFKGANDRVILALIGAGNWGTGLALNMSDLNMNIEIKYVCDVDDTRGGRAIAELEKKQGFAPARVRDMRDVFDDKEVDGVIIATPQHWHGLASIWAMHAGKDVYVEKCMSFT